MTRIRNHWDVIISVLVGATAALCLEPYRWSGAVAELVGFFAIQAAAAYFAMTIASSGVRPEALSLEDVERYDRALKELMLFWKVFLGLNVSAAALLATVKLTGWPNAQKSALEGPILFQHIFSGWLAMLCALAVLRTLGFFRDVSILMRINRELAERIVRSKDAATAEEFRRGATEKPFQTPEGFGSVPPNGISGAA